ncbi:hypothetical protein X922_05435 [Pseudomonas aeruginosa VRFPA08]|nr:hypothetical protein U769_01295 [Pseudomonas aeruginosa MTB-1]ETD53730.1 hypothetical protein X922_05435 [Pseudomonas aeruginosa VRFPA08]
MVGFDVYVAGGSARARLAHITYDAEHDFTSTRSLVPQDGITFQGCQLGFL